jgi:hypothetical protein
MRRVEILVPRRSPRRGLVDLLGVLGLASAVSMTWSDWSAWASMRVNGCRLRVAARVSSSDRALARDGRVARRSGDLVDAARAARSSKRPRTIPARLVQHRRRPWRTWRGRASRRDVREQRRARPCAAVARRRDRMAAGTATPGRRCLPVSVFDGTRRTATSDPIGLVLWRSGRRRDAAPGGKACARGVVGSRSTPRCAPGCAPSARRLRCGRCSPVPRFRRSRAPVQSVFQATGEAEFRTAAIGWFRRTLTVREPGRGLAGYLVWGPEFRDGTGEPPMVWCEDASFLNGVTGIALGLLAAVSPSEPLWDRLLMCNI